MIDAIKGAMLLVGASFMLLAAVGLLRLPDLLTRMHATTKAAALGVILIMLASAMHFCRGRGRRSFVSHYRVHFDHRTYCRPRDWPSRLLCGFSALERHGQR